MYITWRLTMEETWKLHARTHNNLICNICVPFTNSMKKKKHTFIMHCITQINWLACFTCVSSAKSVFAENYRYF